MLWKEMTKRKIKEIEINIQLIQTILKIIKYVDNNHENRTKVCIFNFASFHYLLLLNKSFTYLIYNIKIIRIEKVKKKK